MTPSRRTRVVVLVNPTAGMGVGDDLDIAASQAGLDLDISVVRAENAVDLAAAGARELERGVDALVVQGGDGMVHLGVGLVAGTDVPLGIVPKGTGNDFARAAGIPRGGRTGDALAAIAAALKNRAASHRRMDALRVRTSTGEHWAANSVNVGFDALVNARANRLRHLSGTLRYVVALVLVARDFETIPFRVGFDDGAVQDAPGPLVSIGNGSSVGGGIRLLPSADLADGELDAMLVSPLGRARLAALFPIGAFGAHRSLREVTMHRARRIRVEAPDDVLVYADGEPLGTGSVDVECVPGAWWLLRGALGGG